MEQNSTKEVIYTGARRLFSERGYTGTSIRDIAGAAHIRGASVYSHYDGKEDLLWEMVISIAEMFRERVLPELHSLAPVKERLRNAITAHLSVITENIESATIYFHEWQYLNADRKTRVLARRDQYEAAFRRVIAEGVQSGEIRAVNPRYTSIMLLSSMNAVYTWYRPGGALNSDALAALYTDIFLCSLIPGKEQKEEADQI